MKAVVVHGPKDLRVDEVEDPIPGEGEVVVGMEWGGLCGSDLSYWRNGASGTAVLVHPLILGHEVAGRIIEVGSGVRDLAVGTAVTIHPATSRGGYFGSAALNPHTDGGFSGKRAVAAHQIRVLPEGLDTRRAALAEPLAVAMRAVSRPGSVLGRDILVNGAGPIGALVVAAARHAGAATIAVADVNPAALAVAAAVGADETIDLSAGHALPADVELIFEASGAPGALGAVLHAVARGGTLVQVGNLPGTPVPAVLGDLVTREVNWLGSYRFEDEITAAVAAMADGLDVEPLITHTFGIDDAVQAFETAADRTSGSSKVLLDLR
ncbi:MAG: zinc-binding dehydrogenase [Gordonia sp. (in: high G+C Gram-positive bacteria)]